VIDRPSTTAHVSADTGVAGVADVAADFAGEGRHAAVRITAINVLSRKECRYMIYFGRPL
jgi:hypothetical protein